MNLADLAWIRRRKRKDYERTFGSEHGKRVLADLLKFSGARADLFNQDPIVMANNLGMRRVTLRIESFLAMTEDEVMALIKENDAA